MNTIEQAKKRSKALRIRSAYGSEAQQAADTIDALLAELSDERMRCAQADNAVAQMAAELAALKGQQAIGSVTSSPWRGLENIEWQQSGDIPEGTHMLYLAAGAQPCGNESHFRTRQERAKPVQREPLFWYRPCSDGGYEGPISNGSIEDVRKRSGAWIPLVAAPVQAGAQLVPEGYALISIAMLRTWGVFEDVIEQCQYPAAPVQAGAQPVQAGYQLVRIEPTDQMLEMGSIATDYDYSQERIKRVWQQMLMAAAREQGSPTVRNPRTVESAQDHFAGAGKPIQERIPENCGTGHCSCIACAQVCQWMPADSDDMPGTWESACGEIWRFVEGGPVENNYRFCHGCGKPVEVRP